jgi:RecA/RadA recombinase
MSIEDIKNSLNKKFKQDITRMGHDSTVYERVPFTSPRVNYLTRGGIPFPAATELSGPEGAGKTTLEIDLIKNAQKLGMYCGIIDTENKFDVEYARWHGVDTDNLIISNPVNTTGEDILQLAMDMIEEGIRFCAIDSLAALVPKAVLNGTMDDKSYCGSSGIVSTFSQKISGTGILQAKRACLLGINQVRDKVNGFGLQTPAGHFWRHICMCRLQLSRGNPFDANYKELAMGTTEETAGYKIEIRMLKNQFSKNDRRFNFCTFNYDKGIDVFEDLIDVGIDMNVIYKTGAWYRFVNLDTGEVLCVDGEELKFQGKASVREYLEQNSRIHKWAEMQIMAHIAD